MTAERICPKCGGDGTTYRPEPGRLEGECHFCHGTGKVSTGKERYMTAEQNKTKPDGCKCRTVVMLVTQPDGSKRLKPTLQWNPQCPVHQDVEMVAK